MPPGWTGARFDDFEKDLRTARRPNVPSEGSTCHMSLTSPRGSRANTAASLLNDRTAVPSHCPMVVRSGPTPAPRSSRWLWRH